MLISVVIPIYNGEKYIRQAIESILTQPYKNIEILCINDGSTDESKKIVESILKKDSRVHIINQKNSGVAKARNTGIIKANGEYIAFLDQDDVWVKNALTRNIVKQIIEKKKT